MTQELFSGRIIFITGASRGLGRALALACARQGASLILTAKTQGALEQTYDDAIAAGAASVTLIPMDISDTSALEQCAAACSRRFGKVDALFCCAAYSGDALTPVAHILPKDWHKALTVNATANYHLLRCFDPLLRRAENGAHVLFPRDADISSVNARAFHAVYGASKAAADYIFRAYALESAPFGISVHTPELPPMHTGLRSKLYPGESASAHTTPDEGAAICLRACADSTEANTKNGKRSSPFGTPIHIA